MTGVAAASFFSDAGHEITTAVLPSFLTGTLHTGPGAPAWWKGPATP